MAYDLDMISTKVEDSGSIAKFSGAPVLLKDEESDMVSGGMPMAVIGIAIACAFLLAHD